MGKTRRMEIPVTSFDQWPLRIQRDVRMDMRSLSSRFVKNVFDLHHAFPANFFSLSAPLLQNHGGGTTKETPPPHSLLHCQRDLGRKGSIHTVKQWVQYAHFKKNSIQTYGKRCRIYSGFSSEDTNRGLKCGREKKTFSFSFFFFFCPRTKRIAARCNKDPLGTEWGGRKEEEKEE